VAIVHQFLFQAFEDQHFRNSKTSPKLGLMSPADGILEEPLQIQDGFARVSDRPGIGLTWRSEVVKALSLDR
jgi:L-alanine-DL-glutamate epimerase-like enolase superfamily enzyme